MSAWKPGISNIYSPKGDNTKLGVRTYGLVSQIFRYLSRISYTESENFLVPRNAIQLEQSFGRRQHIRYKQKKITRIIFLPFRLSFFFFFYFRKFDISRRIKIYQAVFKLEIKFSVLLITRDFTYHTVWWVLSRGSFTSKMTEPLLSYNWQLSAAGINNNRPAEDKKNQEVSRKAISRKKLKNAVLSNVN